MPSARPSQSLAFGFGFPLAQTRLAHKRLILFAICSILDKQNAFVNDFSEIRDCEGIRKSRIVNFMTVEWIRDGLKRTRKTRSGLAKALGRSPSAVTDLLNGSRRLRAEEIAVVAEYLGVEPPRLVGGGQPRHPTGRVPLVGYVGAGAIAHFYADAQGPFDEVDAPDAASSSTVAVQIRGHSLGALFDNWLVFYDDVRDPPGEDLIGRMCVCGLADGRVLVKALKRSQVPGMWTLLSNTEPPIYDVALDWAALVREMRPR
jgi:transcriptional regulator with XRE-family HTH domain